MVNIRIIVTTFLLFIGVMTGTLPVSAEESEPIQPHVVNVNTADANMLAKVLKGIGLKKAQAIVAHREQYGEFKTVSELADVKGIGTGTLARNQSSIVLE